MLKDALDAPAVRSAEHVVGVGAAQQVGVAAFGAFEEVLRVHGGVTDRAVGVVLVELDDVVGLMCCVIVNPSRASLPEPKTRKPPVQSGCRPAHQPSCRSTVFPKNLCIDSGRSQ